jgi:hypothetical protein
VVLLVLFVAAILVTIRFLHVESDGHIVDYLIWRWMVTFKRPPTPVHDYRIVVAKAAHRLEVYHDDAFVASYAIALSHRGLQPRRTWADALTPEGVFLIASMQYRSHFGPRQMLLDTSQQAVADYLQEYGEEGRARLQAWETRQGPLDTIWEVYDFNEAYPQQPIWNDILIHGGGSQSDWTLGCIALDNDDLLALFDTLHRSEKRGLGVAVEIRP